MLEVLQKIFSFLLWVLTGLIILPCVFMASVYFPKWEKWGEGF